MVSLIDLRGDVRVRASRPSGELAQREPRHLEDADAPGQRFTHALHQVIGLRTREDDPALLARLVDDELDRGEQLGHALYLVNDEGQLVTAKEERGISLCLKECPWIFHGHIGECALQVLSQDGGFANLPGAGDEDDFALIEHLVDGSLDFASDVHGDPLL